jgi:uncharacterized protein (TIGR02246 family)
MSIFSTRRFFFRIVLLLLAVTLTLGSIILTSRSAFTLPPSPTQMQPDQIRSIVRQARDAWVNGDAAAFAELFAADGELQVPGQLWQGRVAIEAETAKFVGAFNVAIEIQTTVVEGNQAAVEWDWAETPKAGGETRRAQDAIVIEFEGEQIRRWREYIDAETPKTSV